MLIDVIEVKVGGFSEVVVAVGDHTWGKMQDARHEALNQNTIVSIIGHLPFLCSSDRGSWRYHPQSIRGLGRTRSRSESSDPY
jgi:hypothetical protein